MNGFISISSNHAHIGLKCDSEKQVLDYYLNFVTMKTWGSGEIHNYLDTKLWNLF